MPPTSHGEVASQPQSPTTPSITEGRLPATTFRSARRSSIMARALGSSESDDGQPDEVVVTTMVTAVAAVAAEPIVGLQNDLTMTDLVDGEELLETRTAPTALTVPPSDGPDVETFNITHRSTVDGSIITALPTPTPGPLALSPPLVPGNATPALALALAPSVYLTLLPRALADRSPGASIVSGMPRDEEVLMALQLLAYVSKYCNIRPFFQRSHLVPRLKIGSDLQLLDGEMPDRQRDVDAEADAEYLAANDFNIFPLVEKFTVGHHSAEMQYWAGVVMRNLCRKDESRNGIRQCAYYQCGRWEEYVRQFAKCRRCRRTKYCSKECQKSAWVYHRHWCEAVPQD